MIAVVLLLSVAMLAWFAVFDTLQLSSPQERSSSEQTRADEKACHDAVRSGAVAAAGFEDCLEQRRQERGVTFDHSLLIYYILPLGLVWLLCLFTQARDLSPLSVLAAIELPYFCVLAASLTFSLVAGSLSPADFGPLLEYIATPYLFMIIIVAAVLIPVLIVLVIFGIPLAAFAAFGAAITWLLAAPRHIDLLLRACFGFGSGWWRKRYGPWTARMAGLLTTAALVVPAALAFWWVCDRLDGYGSSQIALHVRGMVTILAVGLLLKAHMPTLRA